MAISKIASAGVATDTLTAADLAPDSVGASEIAASAVGISELNATTGITSDYHKVPVFANDSARDSAIGSPAIGMLVYNTSVNAVQQYNGTWSTIAPAPNITGVSGFLNNDNDSTLTIFGSNFNATSVVKMFTASAGGTQIGSNATTTFNSASKLTAVFGAGSIGASGSTAYIEVDNSGATNRFATAITVNADPTVTHAGATGTSANTTTHLGTYGGSTAGGGGDSNTKLLLNFDRVDGSTDFEDSSNTGGSGHKVTAQADAHIETDIAPAIGTAGGKTNASSAHFDGTGDYLTMPNSTDWDFGSAAFTIEAWVRPTAVDETMTVIARQNSGASVTWMLRLTGSSRIEFTQNNASGSDHDVPTGSSGTGTGYTTVANVWTHIAVTRQSDNYIKIFAGGNLVYTSASTDGGTNYDSNGELWIGENPTTGQRFTGYMDGIRISKGIARWTTSFTPPTAIYGAVLSKTIPTITFTGSATQLAADEDIEFTAVENSGKADGSRSLIDTDIGLTLTNLTGADKSKATLTGTITSAGGTTHTNMPLKLQVRKTLGDVTFSNASTTVTFGGSTKTTGLAPAMPVSGTSIAAGTTISTVDTTTQITLSANTTGAVSGGSLIFLDPTRVSHQYNGSDTIDNADAMYTLATATGGAPTLFNARRYVGNATARSITGFGFQPDLIWQKTRSASQNHFLYDSIRGATYYVKSNATSAQSTWDSTSSFHNDGFNLGTGADSNENNQTFIAWGWKAGGTPTADGKTMTDGTETTISTTFNVGTDSYTTASGTGITDVRRSVNTAGGFSIVKWLNVGTGNDRAIPHGLGAVPDFITIKPYSSAGSWMTLHSSLTGNSGMNVKQLLLDSGGTEIAYAGSTSTAATAYHFRTSDGSGQDINLAYSIVAYCWKSVAGVSAFGTYNGGAGAISCGFQPRWVMIKKINASATASWNVTDVFRGFTAASGSGNYLSPDHAGAEDANANYGVELTSTGFTPGTSDTIGGSGHTYIYCAFA